MPDHNSLLRRLWDKEAFEKNVYLVGKYADDNLGLPDDKTLRVFIPDLHWLSATALERYPRGYGFNGNNPLPNGKPLFGTLLDVLEDVREFDIPADGGSLEVFLLGDAFDLWREKKPEEKDARNAYLRIRQDPALEKLIDRLDKLEIKQLTGNHDHWLPQSIPAGLPAPDIRKEWPAAGGRMLLTHGHEYDTIEMGLPDDIQAVAVWIWTNLKKGKHVIGLFSDKAMKNIKMVLALRNRGLRRDFYPTVEPDGAYPIDNLNDLTIAGNSFSTYLDVSSFSKIQGSANDFDHVEYLQFGDMIVAAELNHPDDHSVHVIGHTHRARLLVDRIPPDRPFVTLDCGGWLGLCTVQIRGNKKTAQVPSAQIGVQYGNDIRLYQLGGVPNV